MTITLISTLFDICHKLSLGLCISRFIDMGRMVLTGKAVVLPQFTGYQVLYLCLFATEVKEFSDESSVNYNVHKIVCKNVKRDSPGIQYHLTSTCDILLRMTPCLHIILLFNDRKLTSCVLVKPKLRESCSPFCVKSSAVNPMVLDLTVYFNVTC